MNIIDYRGIFRPYHGVRAVNKDDPELGIIHRPYLRLAGEQSGGNIGEEYQIATPLPVYRWDARYDRNGFRNNTDLKSADICVIGDSFVEGMTVPETQLMTSALARLERKTVANLGQNNYGPQQELIVLQRYGIPLHARVIVWMFFEGNDLSDVQFFDRWRQSPPSFWSQFVDRSFTVNSFQLLKRILIPRRPGLDRAGFVHLPNQQDVRMYFSYPAHPLKDNDRNALAETAQILSTASHLAAAQDSRFMVVFIPDKFRVLQPFCEFPKQSECSGWVLNDLPERFRESVVSISPGAEYLDLTPDLVAAVKAGIMPYFSDDSHWTPEGHAVAAAAISRQLRQMVP